ncbi:MAG: SMP-30/gluconolactonase/LRE family protein [Sphingomonas sp.]
MADTAPIAQLVATIWVGDQLGEGVVWDDRAGAFRWTDIEGRRLHRLDWPSQTLSSIDLPHRLGSFALTDADDTIIAAFEHGFAHYNLLTGAVDWIAQPDQPPGVRLNDGATDRTGRFLAGDMVEDPAAAGGAHAGKLYRLEEDGQLTVLVDGVGISNALCWSPDGTTMYHTDSRRAVVHAYDYGAAGATNGRPIITCPPSAVPDGATVDSAGRLWLARWGGAAVTVHAADGTQLGAAPVPAQQVTCPAFGGAALDVLAVTSAWLGKDETARSADPQAGHLFVYQTDATGIAPARVKL